jgi:alkanesulfonate monooxygenase SsuD/methylene tetrahydromethanopterin reductase-like flavin-dependent oxidoreductase (luciferase family)
VTLRLGYGLLSAQRADGTDQDWTEIYGDLVALVAEAERAGFDSAWVTEHHVTDDGYLSACLPVLAACAARTSRIELGTNVILAPLHHPLRLVEDASAVACLSGGRLLLGLGIGYRDEEFAAFGVPKAERVPRLVDTVRVARAVAAGERFALAGQRVLSRPTPPKLPVWLGSWVDGGIRRAARLADGYLSPQGGLQDTARRVAVLDDAAAAAGRARPLGLATASAVCLGPVTEAVARGAVHLTRNYAAWYSSSSDDEGGRAVGRAVSARLDNPTATLLSGSAQEVVDHLAPLAARFAAGRDYHLVVRLHWPGMGRAEAADRIAAFAAEVAPHLRAA